MSIPPCWGGASIRFTLRDGMKEENTIFSGVSSSPISTLTQGLGKVRLRSPGIGRRADGRRDGEAAARGVGGKMEGE
ncbi:MAG: hypothetical protein D6812_05110 [Deltaproteobacteria bacterium]|nr:MAG: hypothetical protein D6812_05110 [Deltaproteobacteria bacterium]